MLRFVIEFSKSLMHFKLILVAYIAKINAQQIEKTRLLVELCRHGARTSGHIYPLTVNSPHDNFKFPQVLTQTGAQMHYDLGYKYLR